MINLLTLQTIILSVIITNTFISEGIINNSNKLPVIDGKIEPNEWNNSGKYGLNGGDSIYIMYAEDTIFIAIKGKAGGFTSLGVANDENLKILHASTGLITAEYEKEGSIWKRLYDFKEPEKKDGTSFPRNGQRLSENYKNVQMRSFGWYANLIEMGPVSETEYMITLSSIPKESKYLAIVFYQFKAQIQHATFPADLADDMLNQTLIAGSAPESLVFNVSNWFHIQEILH